MKKLSLLALVASFATGCTISLSLVDTHGAATDVIDSSPTTTTEADVSPELSVPTSLIGA